MNATHTTPTVFDCNYPYRLSEVGMDKLTQADGLLMAISQLAGQAAVHNKNGAIEMTVTDLHRTMWGIFCLIDDVRKELVNHEGAPLSN